MSAPSTEPGYNFAAVYDIAARLDYELAASDDEFGISVFMKFNAWPTLPSVVIFGVHPEVQSVLLGRSVVIETFEDAGDLRAVIETVLTEVPTPHEVPRR